MNPESKRKKATRWFLVLLLMLVVFGIWLALVVPIVRAVPDARQQQKSGR